MLRQPKDRVLLVLGVVAMLLFVDLAISSGYLSGPSEDELPISHGSFAAVDPPQFHRSPTFPRLGSVALNLTSCLHHTSESALAGFTCAHDVYDAYVHAHSNGDHFGNAFHHFADYFEERWANDPAAQLQYESPEEMRRLALRSHGIDEETYLQVCADKPKPLNSTLELPAALAALPLAMRLVASSLCRFAPFYEDPSSPGNAWWMADHEEEDPHLEEDHVAGTTAHDAADPLDLAHAVEGHGHMGPHGVDFNTELNWVYAALSHQGKLAIVNLNVVDWGKVASYEERTGYRVLLFDDNAVFEPEAVLYYASDLLRQNLGEEKEFAKSIDSVHRYCFAENLEAWKKKGSRITDDIEFPSHLDPDLRNALEFFRKHADPPALRPGGEMPKPHAGFACFFAFTGIAARSWTDPEFMNPFCTWDTRHLAIHDARHSFKRYSRMNVNEVGDGDAWRCDWFIRYLRVTSDIQLSIRRQVPVSLEADFPQYLEEHVSREEPAVVPGPDMEWVEIPVNVSIGPHDVTYNPHNGLLYVTHYWEMNDPDVRMLPDWTIHAVDGNPASPAFHNPYFTLGGVPAPSKNAVDTGTYNVDGKAYPIDVGGPIDGLHPISSEVDVNTGRVFIANRESNTISVLFHDGSRDFVTDKAKAILKGPTRMAIDLDLDRQRGEERDFSLYVDPNDPQEPTERQVGGRFDFDPLVPTGRCAAFEELAAADEWFGGNLTHAIDACKKEILATGNVGNESIREASRPRVEALVRAVLDEDGPWPLLLQDLRQVLGAAAPDEYEALAEAFEARWLDGVTSPADRDFLTDVLRGFPLVSPGNRTRVAMEVFARAEDRPWGRSGELVEDLLALAPTFALGGTDEESLRVIAKYAQPAQDGSLLGHTGASIEVGRVETMVRAMEPIVSSSLVSGTPQWLAYCVAYSADDWVLHITEGEDPWEARGKEAANGIHPFHCDDVTKIHYPKATPIQSDFVGVSNHHAVVIVREPVGPLLMDYWFEARPRLLQPFDLWFNAGDGNLYVSNFGNHDNLPLLRGWISILQDGGEAKCHDEMPYPEKRKIRSVVTDLVFDTIQGAAPRVSCLLPQPRSGFSANLLLDMDLMPHHLNVNPYTFEVYGGHLLSDYVMAAQFEAERIDWAIPRAHIVGSDVVAGAAAVPNPNPTGMGVNPSTQRLFASHFLQKTPLLVPLTGRVEDASRYVTPIDLRNYTVMPDMIYGGDHHVAVDQTRPPGRVYEFPFYNRTRELNVSGRAVLGHVVAVGDSSEAVEMFWRCTYYRMQLKSENRTFASPLDGVTVRAPYAAENRFTSGRCFNLFDLQPQLRGDGSQVVSVAPDGRVTVRDNTTDRVFWEFGNEHLTFGMLNLFFDPDNVPANLRVRAPHARDHDTRTQVGVQATEELAALWAESDAGPVEVPRGDLHLAPEAKPSRGKGYWHLDFDARWMVEPSGSPPPTRPDEMTVELGLPGLNASVTVGDWWAGAASGKEWIETRIPLRQVFGSDPAQPVKATFRFDSKDDVANDRSGWTIAGLRLENGQGVPVAAYPLNALPDYREQGMVARLLVQDPRDPAHLADAIGFRDRRNGTYQNGTEPATGEFSFTFNATVEKPVLVILHRQDVEPERIWRARKPYDHMIVEASLDGGTTWHDVWRRDSRDAPSLSWRRESVNVTELVLLANGAYFDENKVEWERAGFALPPEERPLRFRLRFDALDPAHNEFPGWRVANLTLRKAGLPAESIDLAVLKGALDAPVETPSWWRDRNGVLAFTNDRLTYATPGGEGGADGTLCRAAHASFGTWGGGFLRGSGSGALTLVGRDLAGQTTRVLHQDGRGPALVADSFQGWHTESYWSREESDPHGIGHPAYVFDPTPEGQGDLTPEDTPVEYAAGTTLGAAGTAPGERLYEGRSFLVEVPPHASNVFVKETGLTTQATALIDDGIQYRRAFVLTPSHADAERLPADLREVLHREQTFLNATHVLLKRAPEPVFVTLEQLDNLVRGVGGQGMMGGKGQSFDLDAVVEEFLRTAKLASQMGQHYGMRDQPVDEYVLDGTRDVGGLATERLVRRFNFSREATAPTSLDLQLDFVARHRFEDTIAASRPTLPRVDRSLLDHLIRNVTLEKLNLTRSELDKVIGPNNLTNETFNDVSWRATHTLEDLGVDPFRLVNLLMEMGEKALEIEVPVSEILNDLDRFQMSLPTFGEAYGVRVLLRAPDGKEHVLASRDGASLSRWTLMAPGSPARDARVTLLPGDTPGAYEVALGADVGRVEKLRVHLDAEEVDDLLSATGEYEVVLESTIRGGDAPSPGVTYEIAYSDFELRVGSAGGNELPDASFTWDGPVGPHRDVALVPAAHPLGLGRLGDQDGHLVRYRWAFPSVVSHVRLSGHELVADLDGTPEDDAVTNRRATGGGSLARNLTWDPDARVLTYEATGCAVPFPTVRFGSAGDHAVTLRVTDDEGGSRDFTAGVLVGGGARRAPEFLVDPWSEGGVTKAAWQDNPGSLLLNARGRSLNLSEFVDLLLHNLTLANLTNRTTLLQHLDLPAGAEVTRAEVENGTVEARFVLNATLNGTAGLPDVLLDWLLVRPGTVRVVGKQAEDATQGTRAQVLLGEMPEPTALSIPLLADLLNGDLGLPELPKAERFANEALRDPTSIGLDDVERACKELAGRTGVCDAGLDDVQKLLASGLLDAWTFRFAIHPEKDGAADLDRTLAQIVVMDTGVGVLYLMALDAVDDVERTGGDVVDEVDDDLARRLAGVDPIVPVTPYLAVVSRLQSEAANLSLLGPALVNLRARLAAPGGLLPGDDLALQKALRVASDQVESQRLSHQRTLEAIGRSQAASLAYIQKLRDAQNASLGAAHLAADAWSANAVTNVSLGAARAGWASFGAEGNASLDAAALAVQNATEAARRVVADLGAATDTTRFLAMDWTESVLRRDPDELEARLANLKDNVTRNLQLVANDTADVYRHVAAFLDRTTGNRTSTFFTPAVDHVPLVIGYDGTQNKALLRIGDEVVREGHLRSPPSAKVYPSMTFSSIGNRTAEVQAIWGERGATLRDGFNSDGDVNASRFLEQNLSKPNARADAYTKVLENSTLEPPHQAIHGTRSAEGWHARVGRGDLANRHRFLTDPLASPPGPGLASRAPLSVNATRDVKTLPDELPPAARARLDQPHGYVAGAHVPPGALQELRVASGFGRTSAPAIFTPKGPPPAPFVFDVRARTTPQGQEILHVAFQPAGVADPPVTGYEVHLARRPDAGDDASRTLRLGAVGASGNLTLEAGVGEPGWEPGKDFFVYEHRGTPLGFEDDWRYVQVRALSPAGAGAFSAPFRVPPTLLDERFGLLRAGNLTGANLTVEAESGEIDLTLWGLGRLQLDTCLGDRVEVTRWTSYPHDEDAARWSRALRVQERGLDTLFGILRQLNQTLDQVPLNLLLLDGPLDKPLLDRCPSLRSLIDAVNGTLDPTVLEGLDAKVNWSHPLFSPKVAVGTGDFNVVQALHGATQDLLANVSLNLSLKELLHGTPATVTWRTAEPEGAYYARTRFLVPGPHLGPLTADTSIDRLLPNAQLGLFNALVPGERFHLLQLGHVDANGTFHETLRVDFDPHLLAPVDVERTVDWADAVVGGQKDPIGALVTGDLPLGYGIVAGDTKDHRELIGSARPDHWYTLEVYAPSKDADVYAVSLNGRFVGQFRTSGALPPNALRVGGSHVPTEILVDDVRFMDALHPPAPLAQVVPAQESFDFATVRYHVPEDGGAPLVDFNLIRKDLDRPAEKPQLVATAAAGNVRVLTDPLSHGDEVGRRYAYSVQAVNALRDERSAGPASPARAVTLPGVLRVSGDVSVAHLHQSDALDDTRWEGNDTLRVGGASRATWRSFFQVNVSQAVDARGRSLGPDELGAATFLAYNLRQDDARSRAFPTLPTVAEVLAALGYNRDAFGGVGAAVTFHTAAEAAAHLQLVDPGFGEYVKKYYGEDAYAAFLDELVGEGRVTQVITCPDFVPKLLGHGHECVPADEEPIHHTAMCDDFARDLETEEQPFNCWNDAIGAYVLPHADFDPELTSWRTQPDHDYYRLDTGVMRQHTRDAMWRRYELLPSLLRDDDGDVTVALRKEKEQPITGQATYASREGASWMDERLGNLRGRGAADGRGPSDFPWSREHVESGIAAARVGGHAGLSTLPLTPTGVTGIPLDAPVKLRVFIPEGSSPRELGLRIVGGVSQKSQPEQPTAGRSCGAYGGFSQALVTWGDELVDHKNGTWILDEDGELDHAADLLNPRERFSGHHVGGIPPARGRWVTLTFDPAQAALEASGLADAQRGLLARLLHGLKTLRGPETNTLVPDHLSEAGAIYERRRPVGWVDRVDHVNPKARDDADPTPYDYHIPEWLFLWQNYDKFIEPWHCELRVASMEFFVVGGEVHLDRVGPDIEPRVRLDAGGGAR